MAVVSLQEIRTIISPLGGGVHGGEFRSAACVLTEQARAVQPRFVFEEHRYKRTRGAREEMVGGREKG